MASKSELLLLDGETVVAALQTEMYAQSTNIIANIIAKIFGIIETILGGKKWGQLTITDKRVVLESHQKMFWCFDVGASFSTLMPNSISSVDYGFSSQVLCFCRKYMFSITTASGNVYAFVLKGGRSQAIEITNATLNTLLKNK